MIAASPIAVLPIGAVPLDEPEAPPVIDPVIRNYGGVTELDALPVSADVYLVDLKKCPRAVADPITGAYLFTDEGSNTVIPLDTRAMCMVAVYSGGPYPLVLGYLPIPENGSGDPAWDSVVVMLSFEGDVDGGMAIADTSKSLNPVSYKIGTGTLDTNTTSPVFGTAALVSQPGVNAEIGDNDNTWVRVDHRQPIAPANSTLTFEIVWTPGSTEVDYTIVYIGSTTENAPGFVLGVVNGVFVAYINGSELVVPPDPPASPYGYEVSLVSTTTPISGDSYYIAVQQSYDLFTLEIVNLDTSDTETVSEVVHAIVQSYANPIYLLGSPVTPSVNGQLDVLRVTAGDRQISPINNITYQYVPIELGMGLLYDGSTLLDTFQDESILLTFDEPPIPGPYLSLLSAKYPVVHYLFDEVAEGSPGVLYDSVSSGIAEAQQNVTYSSDTIYEPAVDGDKSLQFATDANVRLSDSVTLVGRSQFSIITLIKSDILAPTDNRVLFWLDGTFMVRLNNAEGLTGVNITVSTASDGQGVLDTPVFFPDTDQRPLLLIITYSDGVLRAYANGVQWGSLDWEFPFERHSGFQPGQNQLGKPLLTGGQSITLDSFEGLMNHFSMLARALNPSEIYDAYAALISGHEVNNIANNSNKSVLNGEFSLSDFSRYGWTGFARGAGKPQSMYLGPTGSITTYARSQGASDFVCMVTVYGDHSVGDNVLFETDEFQIGVNENKPYFRSTLHAVEFITAEPLFIHTACWKSLVVLRYSGQLKVFENGIQVTSGWLTNAFSTSLVECRIFAGNSGGFVHSVGFNGGVFKSEAAIIDSGVKERWGALVMPVFRDSIGFMLGT